MHLFASIFRLENADEQVQIRAVEPTSRRERIETGGITRGSNLGDDRIRNVLTKGKEKRK